MPGLGGCLIRGCAWSGGVMSDPGGVYLVRGGGVVSDPGGSAWSGGGGV